MSTDNLGQTVADASAAVAAALNSQPVETTSDTVAEPPEAAASQDATSGPTDSPAESEVALEATEDCGNQPSTCDEGEKCCQNQQND